MSGPRVTIVIPSYNRCALVGGAIESALAQDHEPCEVIVVDDGSTDATREAVERYPVRYIRQENAGPAAARNTGTAHARGEWIAWLDDDDRLLPGFVSGQLACAREHPGADLVICDVRLEGGGRHDGSPLSARKRWKPPVSFEALFRAGWAPPCAWLMRAETARALPFDPSFWAEDSELLFRLLAAGRRAVWNPRVLAVYRRHGGENGTAQRVSDRTARRRAGIALFEAYARYSPCPRRTRRTLHMNRARLLYEQGLWREARPHLWAWWRMKPYSLRALRLLLRSLRAD